jgi:hypothetical protein
MDWIIFDTQDRYHWICTRNCAYPGIESQQQYFEESVIIGVERTWPIQHLLSNHESFVPNHVGPLISSDFFYKWAWLVFNEGKNIMMCITWIELFLTLKTDIIESVQETVLINDDDLDIIHKKLILRDILNIC